MDLGITRLRGEAVIEGNGSVKVSLYDKEEKRKEIRHVLEPGIYRQLRMISSSGDLKYVRSYIEAKISQQMHRKSKKNFIIDLESISFE